MKQYFRNFYYNMKHILEECFLLIKHPSRKATVKDLSYYFSSLISDLTHPWYCLKRGIKNLFVWFPIIWKNDVYDYSYLLNFIDKQLEEMEIFWRSDKTWTNGTYHVRKRITWTRKLLKMFLDEHYQMMVSHKYNILKLFNFKSVPSEVDEYGVVITYEQKPEKVDEEINKKYYEEMKKAYEKDDKLFNLFIKNLSKCRNWWD